MEGEMKYGIYEQCQKFGRMTYLSLNYLEASVLLYEEYFTYGFMMVLDFNLIGE